jgi:hypothetical protein
MYNRVFTKIKNRIINFNILYYQFLNKVNLLFDNIKIIIIDIFLFKMILLNYWSDIRRR